MEEEQEIIRILTFYGVLARPLTLLEIQRLLSRPVSLEKILEILEKNIKNEKVVCVEGFYSLLKNKISITDRKWQDLLLDEKWNKLKRFSFFFSFLPFIHFVFISGSLALQNIHKTSDFDVLIGCKEGRIFTARFFSVLLFNLLGIRRKRIDHKISANNKICLNHFVTPASYQLSPPYSIYWEQLYKNLIPFIGSKSEMQKFLDANNELTKKSLHITDQRYSYFNKRFITIFLEFILGGLLGNVIESFLKFGQTYYRSRHISEGKGYKPRVIYSSNELELHTDTKRIDEMLRKMGV